MLQAHSPRILKPGGFVLFPSTGTGSAGRMEGNTTSADRPQMSNLNPDQFAGHQREGYTLDEVAEQVPGWDPSAMGVPASASFRLDPHYPLDRLSVDPKTGSEHGAGYDKVEQDVLASRSLPLVVSDARRAPQATLHDGWHRTSIAKANGLTHHPAFVRDLDEKGSDQ